MTNARVGFTGTQEGMTTVQMERVRQLLEAMWPVEFHHGDCIGADAQAHLIARDLKIGVVIHPPENPAKRAYCSGAQEIRAPLPYLTRNREIVTWTDCLIATPKTTDETIRSGTWSTVRYARKKGRVVWVIGPNGEILSNSPMPGQGD